MLCKILTSKEKASFCSSETVFRLLLKQFNINLTDEHVVKRKKFLIGFDRFFKIKEDNLPVKKIGIMHHVIVAYSIDKHFSISHNLFVFSKQIMEFFNSNQVKLH